MTIDRVKCLPGSMKLFIGNASDAQSGHHLQHYGISAIVNTAVDFDNPSQIHFPLKCKVGLLDGPGNNPESYRAASLLVAQLLVSGFSVLLHCHEGKSRSAAIATMVISRLLFINHKRAFEKLCESRPLCKGMKQAHHDILKKHFPGKEAVA